MIVQVAVPYRVPRVFDYAIDDPDAASLQVGSLVQVPFGTRLTHGYVLGLSDSTDVPASRLKSVDTVLLAEPLFDEQMLKFLRWVSEYYCHPLGETIATAIPKDAWSRRVRPTKRAAAKKTTIFIEEPRAESPPRLTDAQQAALAAIEAAPEDKPVLLHGVTGSGKTEIYMRLIAKVIEAGKGAIVLAPEISLTPQLVGRFSGRFPGLTAVLHSDLSPRERFEEWEKLASGTARIAIGARSAVFAPVRDLGLIVVDEEQEPSFKQEDSLRYHARDIAVVRGGLHGARVLLGSATPSLESFANAMRGKYELVALNERVNRQPLPQPVFVDLRREGETLPETPWMSRFLHRKIVDCLAAKRQALLYLNRLGFAHFLYCRDCGHTLHCDDCDISLTYYKNPPTLKCHYCGAQRRPPDTCPDCGGVNLAGLGVGTEQLEEGLRRLFPEARIGRMDRGAIRTRTMLEQTLGQIAAGEIDIVVGTQMLAKGHDFPGIALVGVLVADASLNIPDFRANERTFQLLTQVAGRAGRAEYPGEVVVQTINPEHWVLRAAAEHATKEFYEQELRLRAAAGFPPARRLVMLRFQAAQAGRVRATAEDMVECLRRLPAARALEFLGPSEAPITRIKKQVRWQCVIKSPSHRELRAVLSAAYAYMEKKKPGVQFAVDVDPVTLW